MHMMKQVPLEERPREKLLKGGVEQLSNEELLVLLLRCGTKNHSVFEVAKELLYSLESLPELGEKTIHELASIPGIGLSKACILMAAIELGKRIHQDKRIKTVITGPVDVYRLVKPLLAQKKQEHFIAVYVDYKSQMITMQTIFVGSLNMSLVHPREVFRLAVKHSAHAIILVHNHPSGDLRPSDQDILITKTFMEVGEMMQIQVLDHLIVTDEDYHSILPSIKK